MAQLTLSKFQLIIGSQRPLIHELKKIAEVGIQQYEHGGNLYYMQLEWIESSHVLYIYGQYDNENLYYNKVVNKETREIEDNPRSRNQVELKKQFFAFYSEEEAVLYLSSLLKKGMLQQYIEDTLQIETLIKNVYSSIDEFVDSIDYLERAEFVEHRRITADSDSLRIRQVCTDVYGLGCPERVSIKMELAMKAGIALKNIIRKLEQRFQQDSVKSVVLVGRDDQNIEHHFNLSSVLEKMVLEVSKNEDERYIENDVRLQFLERLRRRSENV